MYTEQHLKKESLICAEKTRGYKVMTIIELLERNAKEWPNDTALVEINPA